MAAVSAATRIQAELAQSSARDAVKRARARLRDAQAKRARARRTLAKWYRSARARLRERVQVYRRTERDRINREIAGWWAALRALWEQRRERISGLGLRGVEKAKRVHEHERQRLHELAGHRRRVAATWAEHRKREAQAESDEEVVRNLEAHHPELVPVFREMARNIKASPKRSRTEAMLEWAEENSDEILARKAKQDDDEIARMIREHQEAERELELAHKAQKMRRATAAATHRPKRPAPEAGGDRRALPRLKFELGPVETLTGRYSRRTVTVTAPEGGRAVYEATWDTTDTNPRPPLRRLEPAHKKDAPPVEVQRAAETALWQSLEERPRPRKARPARRYAEAVPF